MKEVAGGGAVGLYAEMPIQPEGASQFHKEAWPAGKRAMLRRCALAHLVMLPLIVVLYR